MQQRSHKHEVQERQNIWQRGKTPNGYHQQLDNISPLPFFEKLILIFLLKNLATREEDRTEEDKGKAKTKMHVKQEFSVPSHTHSQAHTQHQYTEEHGSED